MTPKISNSEMLKHIITGLIFCIFIISFSIILTLNFRPLYYADIKNLNISETSGLSEEEIRLNYDALIDYNSIPFNRATLSFPTLEMSETGLIHFEEVKAIFDIIFAVGLFTLIYSFWAAYFSRKSHCWHWLFFGGLFSFILPVVLGILVAVNWQNVFVTFHQLFFDNDYWIFDPATDPVITILPDQFFMHCAILILALIVAMGFLSLFIYSKLRKKAE